MDFSSMFPSFSSFATQRAERLIEPATQRRGLRRAITTDCQVVAEDGFRLLGEQTLDVSPDGLLLASQARACIGENVIVSLRLPRGQSWIDAEGTIVRVVRGLRDRDRGHSFGVRFDRIDDFDLALLRGSLAGFPPTIPARRVRPDYAATIATIMYPVLKRVSRVGA